MENGLYTSKLGVAAPRASETDPAKPLTGTNQIPARAPAAAAADSPAPDPPIGLNLQGSAIHQNLADRLRAAKVPGHAGFQETPAGAAPQTALFAMYTVQRHCSLTKMCMLGSLRRPS